MEKNVKKRFMPIGNDDYFCAMQGLGTVISIGKAGQR